MSAPDTARETARRSDGQFGTQPKAEADVELGADLSADEFFTDASYDETFRGSGWGPHRPTAPATDVSQVRVGDVLAAQNSRFNARNLLRVTSVDPDRGILHGHFADPNDTTQPRMSADQDLAVWDAQLAEGEHYFTSVRGQG